MKSRPLTESFLKKQWARLAAVSHQINPHVDVDTGGDDADVTAAIIERDTAALAAANTLKIQHAVTEALASFDNGTYGVCAACQVQIHKERLEAIPWAMFCVPCQVEVEKDGNNRRRMVAMTPRAEDAGGDDESEEIDKPRRRRRTRAQATKKQAPVAATKPAAKKAKAKAGGR